MKSLHYRDFSTLYDRCGYFVPLHLLCRYERLRPTTVISSLVFQDLNWLRMHSSLTTRVIIAYHFSIVATLLSTTRLTVTHFFRSTLSTGQKRASSTIRFLSRYSVLTERSLLKTPSRTF